MYLAMLGFHKAYFRLSAFKETMSQTSNPFSFMTTPLPPVAFDYLPPLLANGLTFGDYDPVAQMDPFDVDSWEVVDIPITFGYFHDPALALIKPVEPIPVEQSINPGGVVRDEHSYAKLASGSLISTKATDMTLKSSLRHKASASYGTFEDQQRRLPDASIPPSAIEFKAAAMKSPVKRQASGTLQGSPTKKKSRKSEMSLLQPAAQSTKKKILKKKVKSTKDEVADSVDECFVAVPDDVPVLTSLEIQSIEGTNWVN